MTNISGLIFSADPVKETLDTANHLLEFTDEVVILYAGTNVQYRRFCKAVHDKRIRPYYTLKIGYPEPFRHYGIGLCKYQNIAMLDVDERFSDTKAAKRLMDSETADIYRLKRHEITPKNRESKLYTKQYRLFKKGSLEWRGLLHETPKVKGSIRDIPVEELHVIHNTGRQKQWDYNKINEVFPVERPIHMAIRDAYIGGTFEGLGPAGTLKRMSNQYSKYKRTVLNLPKENIIIIKKLRKYGMIKYLGIDTKKGAKKFIKKYSKNKITGIDLLINIIYQKSTDK